MLSLKERQAAEHKTDYLWKDVRSLVLPRSCLESQVKVGKVNFWVRGGRLQGQCVIPLCREILFYSTAKYYFCKLLENYLPRKEKVFVEHEWYERFAGLVYKMESSPNVLRLRCVPCSTTTADVFVEIRNNFDYPDLMNHLSQGFRDYVKSMKTCRFATLPPIEFV